MEREKRRRREAEARKQQALSSSGDGGRLVDYEHGTENDLVRLTFVIMWNFRTRDTIYEANDFVPCRGIRIFFFVTATGKEAAAGRDSGTEEEEKRG